MKRAARLIGPAALAALIAAGCGGQKNPLLLPNQPPEVELFAQRVGAATYRLQWVGRDPDGSVDHFLFAVGSPADDPRAAAWTSTTERERSLSFPARMPARMPAPGRASIVAIEPSVFSVRAVDGLGAVSSRAQLAFYEGILAPRVEIVSPRASALVRFTVPTTVCIEWAGTAFEDDSTAGRDRVVEYKYKLLTSTTEVTVATARQNPDSVRRYYAPRNWEGWVSTRGNVTSAVLRDLTPSADYVFVITCFDQDGNYDPIFSFDKNMLDMRAMADAALPRITVSNEFFFYEQGQGRPLDRAEVIDLDVPAGRPIPFNWFAFPGRDRNGNPGGGPIRGYRWALDLADVYDERQGDDGGHSGHWTRWGLTNTSATVGPFHGGETHTLYIEASGDLCEAGSAVVSLFSLRLNVIQPTFNKELLVVDDTRLRLDKVNIGSTCSDDVNRPTGSWPTQAELDTFLYARGGVPWRCYPPGTISPPGILNGYSFDTLGTNLRIQNLTIPLSTLGHYRNVIWLTDGAGALNNKPGTDAGDIAGPQTSMRYMNSNQKENTLAAYVAQGGRLWLAGGGAATASMVNFNRGLNDNTLPIPRTLTFRNTDNELIPGRFMYEQAHWRSEFKQFKVNGGRIRRYLGRFESSPGTYASLPVEIQIKSPATDPFPPNRTGSQSVFYQTQFDIEFLSAANEIVEEFDPRPHHENLQSTLDTLYKVTASSLQPDTGPGALQSVVMTCYHGADNAPFIVTGFNLWNFRRSQCVGLVDFVLQQLWGMSRQQPVAAAVAPGSTMPPVAKLAPRERTARAAAPGTARRE
jgi:hypothetical protein